MTMRLLLLIALVAVTIYLYRGASSVADNFDNPAHVRFQLDLALIGCFIAIMAVGWALYS